MWVCARAEDAADLLVVLGVMMMMLMMLMQGQACGPRGERRWSWWAGRWRQSAAACGAEATGESHDHQPYPPALAGG